MNIAKLQNYPNLCRGCLKDLPSDQLVSLECVPVEFDGFSAAECYAKFAPEVPQDVNDMLPSEVCYNCLNELRDFLIYRKRQKFLSKFIAAMAQLRQGYKTLMANLFFTDKEYMQQILQKLELCVGEVFLDDLVGDDAEIVKEEISSEEESELEFVFDTVQSKKLIEIAASAERGRPKRTPKVPKRIADSFCEPIKPKRPRGRSRKEDNTHQPVQVTEIEKVSLDNLFSEVLVPEAEESEELSDTDAEYLPETEGNQELYDTDGEYVPKKIPMKKFASLKKPQRKEKTNYICKEQKCKGKAFTTLAKLVSHRKKIHIGNICEICGESFSTPQGLKKHKTRHVGRSVSCPYCDIALYTKGELRSHLLRRHVKKKEVACSICKASFADNRILKAHLQTHSAERKYTCAVCAMTFKSIAHRTRHIAEVHLNKRFECEHCTESYGRKDKLRMHLEKKHGIQSYFVCDICLASYETQSELDAHRNRHNNPKTLECAICLLAFEDRKTFNSHLCITYRDNYICCDRDWRYHQQYNKHQLYAHSKKTNVRVRPDPNRLIGEIRGARKYSIRCPKCEKPFSNRTKKKLHQKTCTDSSPFSLKSVLVS